jgi:nicotinate-nucleotide adenylyltransferase
MLELAAAAANADCADVVLEPCDIEMRRDAPSWTVDTLAEIASRHPHAELFLILGADAYAEIDTWSRPGEIPGLANIVVTTRPGRPDVHAEGPHPLPPVAARADARYDSNIGGYVHTSGHATTGHRIRGIEVSSSEIRSRVRAGLPIEHLTGIAVARYIHEHRLYAADRTPAPAGSVPSTTQGAGKD